jgi:hypothetical protein
MLQHWTPSFKMMSIQKACDSHFIFTEHLAKDQSLPVFDATMAQAVMMRKL